MEITEQMIIDEYKMEMYRELENELSVFEPIRIFGIILGIVLIAIISGFIGWCVCEEVKEHKALEEHQKDYQHAVEETETKEN